MTFNKLIESLTKEKINTEDFKDIVFNSYVPLADKFATIRNIGYDLNKEVSGLIHDENFGYDYVFMNYEINKFFSLFEKYTYMVVTKNNRTIENYDILMSTGFFDIMLKYCENDYEDFSKLCDRVVGIDNLSITREFVSALTTENITKNLRSIKRSIDGISKDKLQILKEIHEYNNPLYKEVFDNTINSAREEAKQKQKELKAVKVADGE